MDMNIAANKSILDKIEIASLCTVPWESMQGDDLSRHCGQCQLSVYNISNMSKREAEKLIQEKEGRLCVRLYRRFDGSVITNDCPEGLRKMKKSLDKIARLAAALLSFVLSLSPVKADERWTQGKVVAHPNTANNTSTNQKNNPRTNPTPMMGVPAVTIEHQGKPQPPADPPSPPQEIKGQLVRIDGPSHNSGNTNVKQNKH